MRVLVLGGYGAVGAGIVQRLRRRGIEAVVAGRDPERADVVVDLRDEWSYRAGLSGMDVVVNAAGMEDPRLISAATEHGTAFVDVTATSAYVEAVHRLEPQAPVLLSVGLAPGLTNLLAADVHDGAPVDIVVLLGVGDAHGAAATDWSYGLLGRTFTDADNRRVRNYSRPHTFDLPGIGRRRVYRLDFSDQHVLTRRFGTAVRTYFGLDSRSATAALAALTWIPGARRLPRGLHLPGTDRWMIFASSGGRSRWAEGHNQSLGTAIITAWAVDRISGLPPGVHHLDEIATLTDLPTDPEIRLSP